MGGTDREAIRVGKARPGSEAANGESGAPNATSIAPLECVRHNTHMNSADVIRALVAEGWFEARQRGSHKQFKHATRPGLVTIPHPVRDLPIGTLRSIERQSGVTLRR